jgi:hypothetical protein
MEETARKMTLSFAGARRMAQLAKGLGLDLVDPLAGDGKRPTNLLFADWRLQRPANAVAGSAYRIAGNNWK